MNPVLQGICAALTSDQILAGLLAVYDGMPAVFLARAPAGAQMPYVALHVDSAVPEEGHASERMLMAIDVYDKAESAAKALEIAGRIERLVDGWKPGLAGATGLAIWRDFKGLVEEDDPSVQHVHLEFIVRYGRNDLFET